MGGRSQSLVVAGVVVGDASEVDIASRKSEVVQFGRGRRGSSRGGGVGGGGCCWDVDGMISEVTKVVQVVQADDQPGEMNEGEEAARPM